MAEVAEEVKPSRAREIVRRFFRYENAVLAVILIALIAGMGVMTKGLTLTRGNISNIWLQSSTRGIAAIGQLFVLLTAGIDVSIGGIGLVAAVLGASLIDGTTGFPATAIAIMLLLGLGLGAFNGSLVSRIGMPSLIVTLGMWIMTGGGAYLICRGVTYHHLPESLSFLGRGEIAGAPVQIIIFIAVAAVAYFALNHTTFGRSIYAVGGNPTSAWLSGINVKNIRFIVFVISGFLGALAGTLLLARTMSGGTKTVAGLELDSIAAACIGGVSLAGGKGTLIGAVIGAIILGVINNGMNVFALDPTYRDVVKGAIIIAAVAVDYLRRR
jgi:putative xylitol transport system permease protein